jgi:hypothetical protein
VKALSLWQPWASLIPLGTKTIETRSWSTRYRGPLAIHAAKHAETGDLGSFKVEDDTPRGSSKQYLLRADWMSWPYRLPLGAVVATCELVDVVPMVDLADDRSGGEDCHLITDFPEEGTLAHQVGGLWIIGYGPWNKGKPIRVEDQRPYGDFQPGRFAWLLDNVVRADEPVPAVGRQGLWEWRP